ncbi:DMT family transporter [Thalassospira alkalitolerans]|uniref:DMT family transporter n=2 Tax=Thalassospira alkalitolerans TaxID=1293890 RepID=UPI003AA8262B
MQGKVASYACEGLPGAVVLTMVGPKNDLVMKGLDMLAWVYLFGAILLEVVGTVSLKLSNGFSDWRFAALSLSLYGVSIWVLSMTLKTIPVSTAYAVWSGLGTAAIAVIGMVFFKEPMTVFKGMFLLMIIGGVVGLNAVAGKH